MSGKSELIKRAGGPRGLIVHVLCLTGNRRASVYWNDDPDKLAENTFIQYKGETLNTIKREEVGSFNTIGQAVNYAALW